VVRIRSDQKLPERVVYDTSLPTIVPPASKVQVAAAPQPPVPVDPTAQARVRDTYAQFVPGDEKKREPQVQRKRKMASKVASRRPNPPMRLAQQSHFGFFEVRPATGSAHGKLERLSYFGNFGILSAKSL